MAGGSGGIASTANFLSEVTVAIYEKFMNGDYEGAELEQRKLRKLRSLFKLGSIPSVLKESLNKIGIDAGPSRLPILPVSPQVELQIQQMVDDYLNEGILELTTVSSRGE